MKELKENSKRARIAVIIFAAVCVLNIFAVVSGLMEYELLERIRMDEFVTEEQANANDLRQAIIGLLQSVAYIMSIIFFLNWFRRAYGNLHRLGIDYLNYKQSMAVWSFFIPFINLYRPYKIMKEIWIETQEQIEKLAPEFHINKSTLLVGIWWTLFLISNYVGQFAFRSIFREDTLQDLINSTMAYMVSDFIDIPAALVTLLLILRISKYETKLQEWIRNAGSNIFQYNK